MAYKRSREARKRKPVIETVDDVVRREQITPPRDDDELWEWVYTVLNIAIPREPVCEGHSAPFRAFADAYFARHPISIWKASRGFGGKSFLLATLSLTEQITHGASVSLLGGSGEQSRRVHSYLSGEDPNAADKFWNAPLAPEWLLTTDPLKRETRTANGGHIQSLMASQASVRGPHPQRLRLDEADEMKKEIFEAALGQTMEGRGVAPQTVISSTHQHSDGVMTYALEMAAERGWPVYEWCYRESMSGRYGWLSESEVERKKSEVPNSMWDTEYELQEPEPEGRAIDQDVLERVFDPALGEYDGRENKDIILVKPNRKRIFYTGTDWAKSQDWSILHTNVVNTNGPDKLAAWARRGRQPWPVMVEHHDKRVEEYKSRATHDATGVGGVVHDYLQSRKSRGHDFSQRKKTHEMIARYVAALESGEIVYPLIRYMYGEHRYATNDQLYGSEHLPDTISAAMLAWNTRTRALRQGSAFASIV